MLASVPGGVYSKSKRVHSMEEVMVAIESHYPGAVNGTTREWDFRLPHGSPAHGGAMVPAPSLRSLAEQVLERNYRVTAKVDAK